MADTHEVDIDIDPDIDIDITNHKASIFHDYREITTNYQELKKTYKTNFSRKLTGILNSRIRIGAGSL